MVPSWEGPTGPASAGLLFLSNARANGGSQKLSGGEAEGQVPCPTAGLALSAREHCQAVPIGVHDLYPWATAFMGTWRVRHQGHRPRRSEQAW